MNKDEGGEEHKNKGMGNGERIEGNGYENKMKKASWKEKK